MGGPGSARQNVVVAVAEGVRRGAVVGVAVAGWPALTACSYATLPLVGRLPLAGWPILAGCWVWAVGASVAVAALLVRRRRRWWAIGCVVATLVLGCAVATTDWPRAYADSQFRLQRGGLAHLAARHRAGALPPDALLPPPLRYLSIDGRAHRTGDALYLPAWRDWRGENGGGFAYFPTTPGRDTSIVTAPGDMGHPVRYLGDGWWWVE